MAMMHMKHNFDSKKSLPVMGFSQGTSELLISNFDAAKDLLHLN
jgi:hypothetical protein